MSKPRRSDRRRSRSLAGFASKDLCETIPTSLEPSERLMMLLESCFQYTLSSFKNSDILSEDIDIGTLHKNGAKCWEKIRKDIEEKKLDKLAVTENVNPNESYSPEILADYNSAMNKYQTESKQWDELLEFYRDDLKKKLNTPYTADTSQYVQDEFCDLAEIETDLSSIERKLNFQVTSLQASNKVLEECLPYNKKVNETSLESIEKFFQKDTLDTPKTLLRKMSRRNTRNVKPYSKLK